VENKERDGGVGALASIAGGVRWREVIAMEKGCRADARGGRGTSTGSATDVVRGLCGGLDRRCGEDDERHRG
jgi:hypothetical protein